MTLNLCRTCLSENDLQELFLDDEPNDISYKLMLVSSLVISKYDNLPNFICYKCILKIDEAYEFRLQCAACDKYFKYQYLLEEEEKSLVDGGSVKPEESDNEIKTESFDVEYLLDEPDICEDGCETNDAADGTNDVNESNDIQDETNDTDKTNYEYGTVFLQSFKSKSALETNGTVSEANYIGEDDISDDAIKVQPIKQQKKKSKPYQCSICGRVFAGSSKLKCHMRVHTGEKPYKCAYCGKTFSLMGNVKLHITRIHNRENSIVKCPNCPKTFVDKHSLIEHFRIHTGETPYKCKLCPKECKSRSNLKYHMYLHTGERKFTCSLCDRKFIGKGDLKFHMRIHNDERPFECSICASKYRTITHLKRHKLTHPDIEKFTCNICNFNYVSMDDLIRHKHLRHPEAMKL